MHYVYHVFATSCNRRGPRTDKSSLSVPVIQFAVLESMSASSLPTVGAMQDCAVKWLGAETLRAFGGAILDPLDCRC